MLPQTAITPATPPGATLVPGGATFRLWAPRATAVHLHGTFAGTRDNTLTDDRLLAKDAVGDWTGFQSGAADGDPYKFWVTGAGSAGYKRDPYARELAPAGFPDADNILRATGAYPWHDGDFRTPDFADMIVYQVHIGAYAIRTPGVAANLLDVACKLPYIAALGVNVVQPLPIDEQEQNPSMGYGGVDLFSPDFPYVAAAADLPAYLATLNALFATHGQTPLALPDIASAPGQLKALVDLCHLHGIAVVFDVVYNHAGGFSIGNAPDDACLYYLDRVQNTGNNNDSLYFTDQDRGTGGLAFALWNDPVRRYLFDNAVYFVGECHADGFRYDEISTLLSTNQASGWQFCRDLTTQLRALQPRLLQNAEFWPRFADVPNNAGPIIAPATMGGAGFDVVQHDALRYAIRGAIAAAAAGADAVVPMAALGATFANPPFAQAWRAVTCIENHDVVLAGRDPRIPVLADSADPASWYARSRTRVANALLLTAPGIPQLFMGQEFAETAPWDSDPHGPNLLNWDGLAQPDPTRRDMLRCVRDLIALRRTQPALRGENTRLAYASTPDRVLLIHRWLENTGNDVLIVASLAEQTWWHYDLGFPGAGAWREVVNTDVYDHWVNPQVAGNGGAVIASGPPLHGFAQSATTVIPANSVLVFVR